MHARCDQAGFHTCLCVPSTQPGVARRGLGHTEEGSCESGIGLNRGTRPRGATWARSTYMFTIGYRVVNAPTRMHCTSALLDIAPSKPPFHDPVYGGQFAVRAAVHMQRHLSYPNGKFVIYLLSQAANRFLTDERDKLSSAMSDILSSVAGDIL